MQDWGFLPFNCGATLTQRWNSMDKIFAECNLRHDARKPLLITCNVLAQLMPFHHQHLASSAPVRLVTQSLFDVNLAGFLIDPKTRDDALEFDDLCAQYMTRSNFAAPSEIPDEASAALVSLLRVKDGLHRALKMYPLMKADLLRNGLADSFFQIEQLTSTVLSAMEVTGIAFMSSKLDAIVRSLDNKCIALSKLARRVTNNSVFNIASPQQISLFLFQKQGLKAPAHNPYAPRAAKTDQVSTNSATLEGMIDDHPLVPLVLEYRKLSKVCASGWSAASMNEGSMMTYKT